MNAVASEQHVRLLSLAAFEKNFGAVTRMLHANAALAGMQRRGFQA